MQWCIPIHVGRMYAGAALTNQAADNFNMPILACPVKRCSSFLLGQGLHDFGYVILKAMDQKFHNLQVTVAAGPMQGGFLVFVDG